MTKQTFAKRSVAGKNSESDNATYLLMFQHIREDREKQERKEREQFLQTYRSTYSDWKAALGDGCAALYKLNRHTKHGYCSSWERAVIYPVKYALVQILYRSGYGIDCFEHHQELDAKPCSHCEGTGRWEYDEESGASDKCYRCNGTGIFRQATTAKFVCFRFDVEGMKYCWHLPLKSVGFPFVTTKESSSFDGVNREGASEMSYGEVDAAVDLLKWIVADAVASGQLAAKEAA